MTADPLEALGKYADHPLRSLMCAAGRAEPVTAWRLQLSVKLREIAAMIEQHEDPERRFLTAREASEDLVHAVRQRLNDQHGRIFDPLIDGPAA